MEYNNGVCSREFYPLLKFEILGDTLLGVLLAPYGKNIRKQQRKNPKFYFFDLGVQRALARMVEYPLSPRSVEFGRAFEHLVILEAHRRNSYLRANFRFSYLRTKDGAEIDLVAERPGQNPIFIEIKSSSRVQEKDMRHLARFIETEPQIQAFCFSLDPHPQKFGKIDALFWQEGLAAIGL